MKTYMKKIEFLQQKDLIKGVIKKDNNVNMRLTYIIEWKRIKEGKSRLIKDN